MTFKNFIAAAFAGALLCAAEPAHAARFFVDNALGDVAQADRAAVTDPKPVQIIFQFKTKGAPNARATNYLKERVTELVKSSGIFSSVTTEPVAGGAIVAITIDNIPQENAASQGFATGLTFGLRGTSVADYYVATTEYVSGPGVATISKSARHTMYTAIGRTEPPANATQAKNVDEAITLLVRQLVERMLTDLGKDAAFPGAAAPPAVAAVVADPAAAPAAATAETPATPAAAPAAPATTTPAPAPAPN